MTLRPLAGTLHAPQTPWMGRADLLAELVQAVQDRPGLWTLTGPGGAGKTRLALQVAGTVTLSGRGCALAEARTAESLVAEVARVLEVPGASAEAVGAALAAEPGTLLVLDNLEQLDDAAARQVGAWLDAAPQLRVLATSRRRLGLMAEVAVVVGALAPAEAEALFVERVTRRRPGYAPDVAERACIAALAERLDHLPLALELAAGRAAALGIAALADALDPHLGDGALDRTPRHATLDATVRWSWDLLTPGDQQVLAGLALLPGPLAVADAAWLGDGVAAALGRLADASLLRPVSTGGGGLAWAHYQQIRDFAVRHATAAQRSGCVAHVLAGDPDTQRGAMLALAAAVEQAGEDALLVDLALALDAVLFRTGPGARRRALLHHVVSVVPEHDPRHAEALMSLALTGLEPALVEPLERAEARARQAGDRKTEAGAALALAQGAFDRGELDAAARWAERCREAADAAELDRLGLGARFIAASTCAAAGDLRGAYAAYQAALTFSRSQGAGDEALIEGQLGSVALDLGEPEAAALLESAIAGLHARGDHRRAMSLGKLAEARLEIGDLAGARDAAQGAVEVLRTSGQPRFMGFAVAYLGLVEEAEGDVEAARTTLARAEALNDGRGHPVLSGVIAAWRARLDGDAGRPAGSHAERSRALLAGTKLARLPDLCAAHAAVAVGDLEPAHTALRESADAPPSVEVRCARARLQAALQGLGVGAEGAWFCIGAGERVDLASRHPIRRVLLRLVTERMERPGRALGVAALFEAGWPGEQAVPKAARNRVYHAVAHLRRAGLEPGLERTDEGWRLTPGLHVRLSRD